MAADYLVPWLNASGQAGLRKSMLVAQGDSVTKTFTFNFAGGYISKDHVKAYVYDTVAGITAPQVITPSMWSGPNQITFPAAFPNTQYLVIYRDTPRDTPLVSFANGAILNEPNLDEMAEQGIFVAAETADRFDLLNDGSSKAIIDSATALNTANVAEVNARAAVTTANAAAAKSDGATSTANAAKATADAAKATADGIDAKAQTALDNSSVALSTANAAKATADAAKATADGIDAKAQTALDNSSVALSTAKGVDAKATQAQADSAAAVSISNGAKAAADAAAAGVGGKVSKSGGVMTGNLTVPSLQLNQGHADDDSTKSMIYNDTSLRNVVFRTGPSTAYKYAVLGADGVLNLPARPIFNGAMPWDTGNFDPNTKLNTGSRAYSSSKLLVGGVDSNFNWSGQGGQPTWIWGGNDQYNMYVYNPSNFSVSYANSAGSVNGVGDPATRGAQCQWSGSAEFGAADKGAETADVPAPWVMFGVRVASWRGPSGDCIGRLVVRGVWLRNQ